MTGAEAPASAPIRSATPAAAVPEPHDQDGPWAALRGQLGDPGLRRVPGGGTDARPGLGGAAEQTAAVGSGQGFRGVEQRLVEHGDGPPITC